MMDTVKKNSGRVMYLPSRRWGLSRALRRAHEEAAPDAGGGEGEEAAGTPEAGAAVVDPNELVLTDHRGNALPEAGAGDGRVSRANAGAATTNAYAQTLSDFVVGQEDEEYGPLIDFLAPPVSAPFIFRYRVKNTANAFAVMQDSGFGVNGRPQVVRLEADSMVLGQLQSFGLMSYLTQDEMDLADSDPQWGQDAEVESVSTDLRKMDRRGLLLRILALFASSAGSATSVTWNASTNPIDALRTHIKTVAEYYGTRAGVRVVFGSDAWEIVAAHALVRGTGTNYPMQTVSRARVAELCGIPEGNIMVSYHQALTTKQGKTASKSDAFTAAQVYIYGASSSPSRNDGTFVKRFHGPYNGQDLWAFRYGRSTGSDPFRENFGFVYRELLSATNSDAVVRLSAGDGS